MALGLATTLRSNRAQEIVDYAGANAFIRIYDGSRPATGASITTQNLLAELTCAATLGTVSNGVLTFNTITQDPTANNTGTASWFRIVRSDGTTFCVDGSAGTSGSDMNLVSTSIVSGTPVQITSGTFTEGGA